MTKNKTTIKNNAPSILFWMCLILLFSLYSCLVSSITTEIYFIILSYLLLNIAVCIFPKDVKFSLPIIVIRVTGIIRYIMLPILSINSGNGTLYTTKIAFLMIAEIVSIALGLILFARNNKIQKEKDIINEKMTKDGFRLGISTVVILIIGAIVFIIDYSQNVNPGHLAEQQQFGGLSIIINSFILLSYIYLLNLIKYKKGGTGIIKLPISMALTILFIYLSSMSNGEVSRWSIVIYSIIAFIYLSRLYPHHVKQLFVFLSLALLFSVTIASTIKFANNDNYKSVEGTIEHELGYSSINAYFSGPSNMDIANKIPEYIKVNNIPKHEIIISDIFGNFPILNRYIGNERYQSASLFNYVIYGSTIAKDQIIPYSSQLNNLFGLFFVAIETMQIYIALYLYSVGKSKKDYLLIFCCIYLSFFLSLTNCINASIILQELWIHIVPVYLIYVVDNKMKITKKERA